MRLISVINQKGGVGKTTTTCNLAHALMLQGHKVTVLDLDPQGHLTSSLGVYDYQGPGVGEILLDNASVENCVLNVRENLNLIPSSPRLADVEQQSLTNKARKGLQLRKALTGNLSDQDFVLIDCPPASGLLIVNAVICTREVLVPVVGDYLSLQGLSYLMGTFRNFEQKLGCQINSNLVVTRYHANRKLPREIIDYLYQYFSRSILPTRIRETTALAECAGYGKTIFEYRKNSNGAKDYRSLAEDLVCAA